MNKNMFKRNNKVITSVFLIVFMAWMLFISVHSKQEQLQNNKTVFGFFFEETDADKVIDKIGRKNIYAIGKNTVITKEQVKNIRTFIILWMSMQPGKKQYGMQKKEMHFMLRPYKISILFPMKRSGKI